MLLMMLMMLNERIIKKMNFQESMIAEVFHVSSKMKKIE